MGTTHFVISFFHLCGMRISNCFRTIWFFIRRKYVLWRTTESTRISFCCTLICGSLRPNHLSFLDLFGSQWSSLDFFRFLLVRLCLRI